MADNECKPECQFIDPQSEFWKEWREVHGAILKIDLAVRGNGNEGLKDRIQRIEERKKLNPAYIRMSMSCGVVLVGMAAMVFMTAVPVSINYLTYGAAAFLFGDSVFTSLKSPKG